MKQLTKNIIVALFSVMATTGAHAQEFVAPTKAKTEFKDSTTTFTYKMTDATYKVFKTRSGAFYIWKKSSKSGRMYRHYLPKEIQKQMGRKYE